MRFVLEFLHTQPFILLFLAMAGGYALAKVGVKGISLGATAATMLVSLGISLAASAAYGIEYALPEFASALFFNLFMFAIGMKVGSQFLAGLHLDAKNFILLAFTVPALATVLALLLRVVFRPPPGMTAGIFAGANTATPGLGAAQAAYSSGAVTLPAGTSAAQVVGNMSTAFAFSYCISMVTFIVLLKLLPRLFGRDAVADAAAFERRLAGGESAPLPGSSNEFLPGALPVVRRVYRVEQDAPLRRTLGELRRDHPLVSIEGIERGDEDVALDDDTVLERGDLVALYGRLANVLPAQSRIGPEVDVPRLREVNLETADVVQKDDAIVGKTLADLARDVGHGLYLNAMFRGGEAIPRAADVKVRKGDVFRVTGTADRIAKLAARVGPVVKPSMTTDLLTLCLGLCAGALLGSLTLHVGSVGLSLGSVALLLVGVALSTLRTRNPALGGPFPEPARQLIEDLGLNVFIAVLGLNAGAGVMKALGAGALVPVVVGSLVVGILAAIAAWVLGQYAFKMNSAELLGAVAGARCNSAGMRAAQEASRSTVPAIAYPATFAISNVLLTIVAYFLALMD